MSSNHVWSILRAKSKSLVRLGYLMSLAMLCCHCAGQSVEPSRTLSAVGPSNSNNEVEESTGPGATQVENPAEDPQEVPAPPMSNIRSLLLRFLDRSVVPEGHRSYTLRVNLPAVDITVDVYGTIIAESHAKLSDSQWGALAQQATQLLSEPEPAPIPEGLTGNSSFSLEVERGEGKSKVVWLTDHGDGWDAFALSLTELVPDFKALLKTPYGAKK